MHPLYMIMHLFVQEHYFKSFTVIDYTLTRTYIDCIMYIMRNYAGRVLALVSYSLPYRRYRL